MLTTSISENFIHFCLLVTTTNESFVFQEDDQAGGEDYKENQRFADHMKDKSQSTSEFATQKTLKEQRQFLPIFSVRQEVKCAGGGEGCRTI